MYANNQMKLCNDIKLTNSVATGPILLNNGVAVLECELMAAPFIKKQ